MREIIGTVRQALDLLNSRLRRRWLLHVPWALFSAALEMVATTGMLILIRLISDPRGAERIASLRLVRHWVQCGFWRRCSAGLPGEERPASCGDLRAAAHGGGERGVDLIRTARKIS